MQSRKKDFKIDSKFTRSKPLPGLSSNNSSPAKFANQPIKPASSPAEYNAALVEGNQMTHDKFLNAAAAINLPLRHEVYYGDTADKRKQRRAQERQEYDKGKDQDPNQPIKTTPEDSNELVTGDEQVNVPE